MRFSTAINTLVLLLASSEAAGTGNTGLLRGTTNDDGAVDTHVNAKISQHRRQLNSVETINIVDDTSTKNGVYLDSVKLQRGGYYACGAAVQTQSISGSDYVFGLKLQFCSLLDWNNQETKTIRNGSFGSFNDFTMCPKGTFIRGAQANSEHVYQSLGAGLKILCQDPDDTTKEGTWVTIVEQISHALEDSVIFPDGRFVKGAQVRVDHDLVPKLEDAASPYCDVVDACNPGTFQGKRWYCQNNPTQQVGSGCRSGWKECKVGANPKKFDGKYWVCPTDRKLPTGESCSTDWITHDYWSQDCSMRKQYTNVLNGLGFVVDELHFGVSQEPVNGEWHIVGSGPDPSFELTESLEISNGQSVTDEFSYGFEESISTGFEAKFFGVGLETEVSVSASQAFTTATAIESTLTRSTETTFGVSCGDSASDTGLWFIYQWVMYQEGDDRGPGFNMHSTHFACTATSLKPPRCPLGYCSDMDCQNCFAPFEYLSEKST